MTMSMGAALVSADDAVWKIGMIGPLTGPAANYGTSVDKSAQIAVEEINAAGGINGYQIEYRGEDDELDSEKSVNAYNTLKDWGMQILDGCTTSGCSIAVSEKTKEDKLFQITPSGSADDCTKYDNVFRVCFSDPQQGIESAKYIGEHGLAKTVGVIYDSSDVYSSGIENAFKEESANQDFEIVVEEAFTADSNSDFSSQLQKMVDANVDLVFLPIYYTQAGTILTQAFTMGLDTTFFGCDGFDGMLEMDNFQKELAEGVMLLTPFSASATDEKTVAFVKAFQDAFDMLPNQFGADSYDAIYAIKAAAEKQNLTPDMSIEEICEGLKAGMVEISIDGLTGTNMTWSAEGNPSKEPNVYVIKDGAYSVAE
ncbi:MAG: ABC transporter substrate-binding protein [Lachnospiraceae bacterium]|nr:ABC transporter substrate-binding protein [Lachnospiraceae bacterium]